MKELYRVVGDDRMSDFIQTLADAIMDTLEDFFSSFTVPTGKNLKYSLFVLIGFLLYSIIGGIFNLPSFVQWQEALVAVIIVSIVCLIDSGNRSAIKKITTDLKNKVVKYKEVEDDD